MILVVFFLAALSVLFWSWHEEQYSKKKKTAKRPRAKRTMKSRVIVEPSLDTPNSVPQPLPENFARSACHEPQEFREPESDEESELLNQLTAKITEFTDHLKAKYPDHPMARRVLENWNGEIKISTRKTGATFYRGNGCMIINPNYESTKKVARAGNPVDSFERLLTRLLHELAHSWYGNHSAPFYDAQRWFLRVATEDLGWTIDVNCRVCCGYTGAICSKQTVCPKCNWLETGCSASGGKCNIE
jgi:hypothetical protein